ncbi:transglutaminase family protein [Anatilimnocola sp. NA78]|uniref:transglutaminase family protein n=1 Tax=Anatilimnocola sp. NA78 TaxID=3415683 RepID=UPI003CE47547
MRHETGIEPMYCRPEAYRWFADQMADLNTTDGLLRAAIAVSLHALDDIAPERVEQAVLKLADKIRSQCRSDNPNALLAHLHDVFFEEERFVGNLDNYYVALNSYVPVVLNTRRGLPIILALLYKAVGEKVGLHIEGVNSPAHFLARVRTDEGWLLIDPFYGGQALTTEEAFRRIEQVAGRKIPRDENYLAPATHSQWLGRILANLQALFAKEGRHDDLAAMTELQHVLSGVGV